MKRANNPYAYLGIAAQSSGDEYVTLSNFKNTKCLKTRYFHFADSWITSVLKSVLTNESHTDNSLRNGHSIPRVIRFMPG